MNSVTAEKGKKSEMVAAKPYRKPTLLKGPSLAKVTASDSRISGIANDGGVDP
jgi:hypothetical protein